MQRIRSVVGSAVLCLTVAGIAVPAEAAFTCGGTVGPGGTLVMTADITGCASSPALTLVGPVTVDMNGHTVGCSSGTGIGIEQDGTSAILKNGVVGPSCGIAVVVSGSGRHQVLNVLTRGNTRGFQVRSDGNHLLNDSSRDAGGLGFELDGSANAVKASAAVGNDTGFLVATGTKNTLTGNTASQSVNNGFDVLGGTQHDLSMNTAISSGLAGFSIGGSQSKLFNNTAASNATEGLLVGATGNIVKGNRAYANASEGIHITGSGGTITKNVALGNGTVDLEDNNATCDSNTWTHDIFGSASPAACIH